MIKPVRPSLMFEWRRSNSSRWRYGSLFSDIAPTASAASTSDLPQPGRLSPRRKRSHPLPAHNPGDFKSSSSRLTLPVPMIRALPSCQRDEIDIPPLIPSSCVPLGIQAAWRFPRVNRVRAECPCCLGHLRCWKVIWGRGVSGTL